MKISDDEILNNEITEDFVKKLLVENKEEFGEYGVQYDDKFISDLANALRNYKVDLKKEIRNARRLSKKSQTDNK